MKELIDYLNTQNIAFEVVGDVCVIDGKTYGYFQPNIGEKVFDKSFNLNLRNFDFNTDFIVFKFGGHWYYTDTSKTKDITLKPLKYIGRNAFTLPTEFFLGVHGEYEILNGSGNYSMWVQKAKFLGIKALGICEKNTLSGALLFQNACVQHNIKPVIGMTCSVQKGSLFKYDIKAFATNNLGWSNLLYIHTSINVTNRGCIDENEIFSHKEGLVFIFDPKSLPFDKIPQGLSSFYQLDTVEFINNDTDRTYLKNLQLYVNSSLEPVPITDAFYIDKEYSYIQKKLNTIAGVFTDLATNQYLKSKEEYFIELESLTKNELRCDNLFEKVMLNEKQLMSQFHFQIPQGGKYLPKYKMSDSEKLKFDDNNALFWNLINKGLLKKISVNDREKYIERIGIEYDIIELGGFVDYFLILWDVIRWSNENGILSGIARGSSGGSLIAYLLNITRLDPIKYDLLFERFLNKGRVEGGSLPDIDCDFAGDERERVKQYMEQKYGQAHVCSVGSYNTLQIKAAIKDLSRLKNLDIPYVNLISSTLEECNSVEEIFKKALTKPLIYEFIQDNADIINDLMIIRGAPRSESIHPCATIILPNTKTIYDWIPVKTVTTGNKDTILVSSWEGSELESIGLLKEDILGIRQLDKFQFILNLIEKKIDIYNIDFNEKRVYEYFCEGWTSDVFHFGAKGLTKYCKESQPHNIDDLIAAIALYRPGPIESDLHNEYTRRKNGDSPIEYLWGTKHITKDTYGILIYQEQIMQVCTDVGGFSLMESDDIRRAMGKKKPELLESYKNQFIENAINKGCHNEDANHLWETLEKFASYGFNKCISGEEKIKRFGIGENSFYPTIKDMWMIKNDSKYAWSINKNPLHQKYKYIGYGFSYSLNERGLLIKNKIKDIRYVGVAPIYRMILENDTKIDVTLNHKFPTSNGEKMLMDIDINLDKIYFTKKGLCTELLSIKSIEYLKDDEVFDVEMEHPNHTFVIENGIVTSNSHAAAYTLTAYICNWFKVYYPIEFWTSAFEFLSESDREEKTIRYISEIKNSGRIQIIPVDINKSKDKIFADKSNSIYWSFNSIKNIANIATDALIDERNMNGDFFSFDEFLSRFNTKGSKINKTHIEHLIVCGAFDKIEDIGDNLSLRLKLIEYYREKRKVKIDKEKDIFVNNDTRIYENWWWQLYQKQLSGLSFFNYKDLVLTYLQANLPFLDSNLFQDSRTCNQSYLIGGYIVELNERTSKNSTYCIMKIESNYQIATVIIMAGIYGKIKTDLTKGSLCLFTGYVKWNDFYNENVIKIDKGDEIVLLNLK